MPCLTQRLIKLIVIYTLYYFVSFFLFFPFPLPTTPLQHWLPFHWSDILSMLLSQVLTYSVLSNQVCFPRCLVCSQVFTHEKVNINPCYSLGTPFSLTFIGLFSSYWNSNYLFLNLLTLENTCGNIITLFYSASLPIT